MLVRELMSSPAVTVTPETSLKDAIRLLDRHRITAMPVIDEAGHLVGVISEADVLRDVVPFDERRHGHAVEGTGETVGLIGTDVVTHLPLSASPDDEIADAIELLVGTQVKSLPVVGRGRVVGVISRRDVIAVLAREDASIEAELIGALRQAGVECTVSVDDGIARLSEAKGPDSLRVARLIAGGIPGVVGVSTGSAA